MGGFWRKSQIFWTKPPQKLYEYPSRDAALSLWQRGKTTSLIHEISCKPLTYRRLCVFLREGRLPPTPTLYSNLLSRTMLCTRHLLYGLFL